MSAIGAFTFVLHSHLPYARMAGRWPHGEEWIHEAATETYLPLLQALYDLRDEGVKYKITIGITPILAEQLADADVLRNLDLYIDDKIERARKDIERFSATPQAHGDDDLDDEEDDEFIDDDEFEEDDDDLFDDDDDLEDDDDDLFEDDDDLDDDDDFESSLTAQEEKKFAEPEPEAAPPWWAANPHVIYLGNWYLNYFEGTKRALHERFGGDLIGAFKRLQDEGYIEITTSAATHGYLPLLGTDSAIQAQLKTGVESYKRHFGRAPRGIWLPECAYRPAYIDEHGKVRPGIEKFLAEEHLKVFFSETHLVTGGQPVGVAAADIIGPYGAIKRRYVVPMTEKKPEKDGGTTFQAYYVSDTTAGREAQGHSGVAVIGRNNRLGMQVWSAEWGYPGDFDYREFHRKDDVSGFQYWRVTGKVDLGQKDLWHPDWAANKVQLQADDFAQLAEAELRTYHDHSGKFGLIACNYDTELFGHWWFEGIDWIKNVLRRLAASPNIQLTTASEFIEQHPPEGVMNLPEGSWGAGGTHFTWDNHDTHWMWEPIHEAERRMEALATEFPNADANARGVLNQTARELLLLEASDWPFLVTTGQAREYSIQRFSQHVERFNDLADSIERGQPDGGLAARLWELDRVFPEIHYTDWAAR